MFLPLGDTPNPRGFRPWINWTLIAANVAVYLLVTLPLGMQPLDFSSADVQRYLEYLRQSGHDLSPLAVALTGVNSYDVFVFFHGFKPGDPSLLDLFTSMFLHGGFLHLTGNMLFLWIFGDNVEHRLGRVLYLAVYSLTGALATISFSLLAGKSMTPLVGASGAISGVLGIYFLLFPRNKVKVFVFLFPFFANTVLLPVRWVLGIFVVIDNLLPLLVGAESGVAYGAHLGGFLGGLGLAYLGEAFSWRLPWRDKHWRLGRAARRSADASMERLRQAVADGNQTAAVREITGLGREDVAQLQPAECVLLSEWLEQSGHPVAASNLLRRCLAAHGDSSELARVFLALGMARLRQGQQAAAFQHLQSVFDYKPDPETEARARQALESIDFWRRR